MSLGRLFGWAGMAIGALVPLACAAAAAPTRNCFPAACLMKPADRRQEPLWVESIWVPSVDEAPARPGSLARRCRTVPGFRLDLVRSPLPSGFDPRLVAPQTLYACVRIVRGGRVAEVRLIGGTRNAAADAALARHIAQHWSFDWPGSGGRWLRIRLDAPPGAQLHVMGPPIFH